MKHYTNGVGSTPAQPMFCVDVDQGTIDDTIQTPRVSRRGCCAMAVTLQYLFVYEFIFLFFHSNCIIIHYLFLTEPDVTGTYIRISGCL